MAWWSPRACVYTTNFYQWFEMTVLRAYSHAVLLFIVINEVKLLIHDKFAYFPANSLPLMAKRWWLLLICPASPVKLSPSIRVFDEFFLLIVMKITSIEFSSNQPDTKGEKVKIIHCSLENWQFIGWRV